MPEWKISDDQKSWEFRDGDTVLSTLRWDKNAGTWGAYVDSAGLAVSKKFDEARKLIEQRAAKGAKA